MFKSTVTGQLRSSWYHPYKEDRRLYAELAKRLSLAPTSYMTLHAGDSGAMLFGRYGADSATWKRFREQVSLDYPGLPIWTSRIAEDGQVLCSVPERLVYESFRAILRADISLEVHPYVGDSRGDRRADFRLTHEPSNRNVHIEVAGRIARDGRPRTPREASYRRYLMAKLEAYAAAGLAAPALIFIDEVCRPEVLPVLLHGIVADLRGTGS